jgi:hypothetical protein
MRFFASLRMTMWILWIFGTASGPQVSDKQKGFVEGFLRMNEIFSDE